MSVATNQPRSLAGADGVNCHFSLPDRVAQRTLVIGSSSPRRGGNRWLRAKGFTLIELMIVVAVIAILAAIAYPSYQEQVRRGRRADAKATLMELSQFMERHYTENNRYTTAGGAAPTLPFTEAPKEGAAKYYDLSLSAVAQQSYTLSAVPKGAQAGDRCGNLTLTSTGVKGATGAAGATECWGR